MKDIRQKLLATFEIEHRDHVEQIRSLVGRIDSSAPAGPELEEAFRRAHSLKGAARAVDLRPIEALAHRMETLFSRVRQGALPLDQDVRGVVLQALDASEDCIAERTESGQAASFPTAFANLEKALGNPAGVSFDAAPVSAPRAPAVTETYQPVETVRVTVQNFEGLFRSADRVLAEVRQQEQVTGKLSQLAAELARLEREAASLRKPAVFGPAHPQAGKASPEFASTLDSLERGIRAASRRAAETGRFYRRTAWTMGLLAKQLQREVWEARMVPAESLVEGFRKTVRDLARDEGKQVEFQPTCANVQADRRVLELLKDPIMHLLRNAVSHGIEPAEERGRSGKPRIGIVTLRVNTNGQRLQLIVEDDGRGIDFPRVAKVAVKEGILSEAEATRSSPADLSRILLRPWFSTAKAVTTSSGRGMGLSVVYEAVRRLQGDLDIQPGGGAGTAILISVPLSVTTHRVLLVRSGAGTFAVPVFGIESLRRLPFSAIDSVEGRPTVVLDGQSVKLASLAGLLGLSQPVAPANGYVNAMVVRSGAQRLAVVVDSFVKETEAVIQDLGAAGCGGKVTTGIVVDGSIALLVTANDLMETSAQVPVHAPFGPPEKPVESQVETRPASILVVDDSLTTRTLEKSILEAHGYRVRVAVDGMEALARLSEEQSDLVIADIEMPRLNGFGLIEAMKKDRTLDRIPVIIVSSLERREDQERGLSLGADAYVVKRKFDQGELLGVIRQILGAGLAA